MLVIRNPSRYESRVKPPEIGGTGGAEVIVAVIWNLTYVLAQFPAAIWKLSKDIRQVPIAPNSTAESQSVLQ